MLRSTAVVAAFVVCSQSPGLPLPARPELSGRWKAEDQFKSISSPYGSLFTITQTAERLTLEIQETSAADHHIDYKLGGESRKDYPPPPHRTPGVVISGAVGPEAFPVSDVLRVVSRTAWMGDQLVVMTHRLLRVTLPYGAQEYETEVTERIVLTLETKNRLVVEIQTWIDPPPYGSTGREPGDRTWVTVYNRADATPWSKEG
jgi:hypothetical protein